MDKTIPEELQKHIDNKDYDYLLDWALQHDNGKEDDEILKTVGAIYMVLMKQGNALAANNHGSLYYNGRGHNKNYKIAVNSYTCACISGIPMAYSNLGCCYYYGGYGIEQDLEKAYRCFTEGALMFSEPNCLNVLGDMYRKGQYVEEDGNKAFQLYLRALKSSEVDNGYNNKGYSGEIRLNLGICFLSGIGTEVNVLEALCNLNIALNMFYENLSNGIDCTNLIKIAKDYLGVAEEYIERENMYKTESCECC